MLKSDLKTNVDRPHFNPSFLSPDFHNLSQGPHFEKSRWATHNISRDDKNSGDPFTAFPQHPVHDDTFNETRRMKSAGRIPAITSAQYEQMRSQTQQAYDHEEHMKRLAAYATPKKTVQNEHKYYGLVESAGVPSNCSPHMYFQLRKFLRFPSANSTTKASYMKTRPGFGSATKYNYE